MEHGTLKIQKEHVEGSQRVKSVDLHPTKPWILQSLYSGTVSIWNYEHRAIEKSFKVSETPVRSAKFIPGKNWIVVGADDGCIRVFDCNTSEKIQEFKAHEDYIRCVAVHPMLPYVLTASDDKLIKLWNWEKDWACCQTFEGHSHYVMKLAFNPKDSDSFASVSLDGTIKIWSLASPITKFTIVAHAKGLNCIEYLYGEGDNKLYLLGGSDDYSAKVWDYESKSCVQTLEGHLDNVTAFLVHPELPIIVTGSEDKTVRLWSKATHQIEFTWNNDLGRVWDIGFIKGSNEMALACDDGMAIIKIIDTRISP